MKFKKVKKNIAILLLTGFPLGGGMINAMELQESDSGLQLHQQRKNQNLENRWRSKVPYFNSLAVEVIDSAIFSKKDGNQEFDPISVQVNALRDKRESNSVAPYINTLASLAVARYVPEVAESLLPRLLPEKYVYLNAVVPPTIKYGAYWLGAHFLLKKGLGIQYSDFFKKGYLQKVATNAVKVVPLATCHPRVAEVIANSGTKLAERYLNSAVAENISRYIEPAAIATGVLTTSCLVNPNFAPAALCHPQVAQVAADCCTHVAAAYLSDSQLETLERYAAPAFMAAGALGTLYLVNKNVFSNTLFKKVKKICKDIRPYAFIAPLAVSYNADTAKNCVMAYVPDTVGKNLHSDIGTGVKAGIYWGSIGVAAYLFATETVGLANQGHLKKKVQKLYDQYAQIRFHLNGVEQKINAVKSTTKVVRVAQAEQIEALIQYSDNFDSAMSRIMTVLKKVSKGQIKTEEAVRALERYNESFQGEIQDIALITAEIAGLVKVIKDENAEKIEQFKAEMQEGDEEFLQCLTQNNAKVESKFAQIEEACNEDAAQLNILHTEVKELLELLHKVGQTYLIGQKNIAEIAGIFRRNTAGLDKITKEIGEMQKLIEAETPGND